MARARANGNDGTFESARAPAFSRKPRGNFRKLLGDANSLSAYLSTSARENVYARDQAFLKLRCVLVHIWVHMTFFHLHRFYKKSRFWYDINFLIRTREIFQKPCNNVSYWVIWCCGFSMKKYSLIYLIGLGHYHLFSILFYLDSSG